jgi:hypothetical protein
VVVDVTTAAPTEPTPQIDTCPVSAPTDLMEFCLKVPEATVCAGNQEYKNEFCALCNNVSSQEIEKGPCFSGTGNFVSVCPDGADPTLVTECKFFSQAFVCDTVNY